VEQNPNDNQAKTALPVMNLRLLKTHRFPSLRIGLFQPCSTLKGCVPKVPAVMNATNRTSVEALPRSRLIGFDVSLRIVRCITAITILSTLTACVQHGSDVLLEPGRVSPPAAFTSLSGATPYVRTWADFDAYRSAAVEASYMASWQGEKVVPGQSIVIRLNEGSRIENTTAHPQFFDIWLQIPEDITVGQPYQLRRASDRRKISRTRSWGVDPDDKTDYSLLTDGEMTLAGMQGYAAPKLRKTRGSVAAITVKRISDKSIVFKLHGQLPVFEDMFETLHYNVIVDRTYEAQFRLVKDKQ
jgi:hypothetical protein